MRNRIALCLAFVLAFGSATAMTVTLKAEDADQDVLFQEDEQNEDYAWDDGTVYDNQDGDGSQYQENIEVSDLDALIEEDDGEDISYSSGEDIATLLEEEEEEQGDEPSDVVVIDNQIPYIENASAEQIAYWLTELEREPSPTGSDGELVLSRFLQEQLQGMGYTVSAQSFHEGFLNKEQVDVPGINLVAERGADGENRDGSTLLICAHYDSKTDPLEGDLLANDKNGAAVLLETARILASTPTNKNLCFVLFSGEEDGWYGSQAFVDILSDDLVRNISGAICIGPVGYTENTTYAVVTEDGASNETAIRMLSASMLMNLPVDLRLLEGEGSHTAFLQAGIPAATILDLGAMGVVFDNAKEVAEELAREAAGLSAEEMSEEETTEAVEETSETSEKSAVTVEEAARELLSETEKDPAEEGDPVEVVVQESRLAAVTDVVALTAAIYMGNGQLDWINDFAF